MWMEELANGKYKFNERYKDPLTEKYKYVSVTLNSKSNQAKKQATSILEDKISNKVTEVNQSDMTFEELYNKWIVYYKANVKLQTYYTALSAYRVVTGWFDKEAYVRNITASFVQNLLDDFYYNKGYSHSYTDVLRTFLSNLLEYGKNIGVVEKNIMREVRLKKKKDEVIKQASISDKFLEQHELELVINSIRKRERFPRKERYADGIEFMSLTGLRYGEMGALKVDDLLEDNKLRIDETLFYNYGDLKKGDTDTPKNFQSNRTIVLSDRCVEIIDKWKTENNYNRSVNPDYKDMGFLFCTKKGYPIHLGGLNRILRILSAEFKEKGILDKKLSSHIFRHTHISRLAEMGIPIKTIMERVGHSEPKMTLKVYTHVTKKMEDDLLRKLNAQEKKND